MYHGPWLSGCGPLGACNCYCNLTLSVCVWCRTAAMHGLLAHTVHQLAHGVVRTTVCQLVAAAPTACNGLTGAGTVVVTDCHGRYQYAVAPIPIPSYTTHCT